MEDQPMRYFRTPTGWAGGTHVEVQEDWEEISLEEYVVLREEHDQGVRDRLAAERLAREEARAADAQAVYDGAVGAGLPEPAALIMARQVSPAFDLGG